jgi:hypothetical protein
MRTEHEIWLMLAEDAFPTWSKSGLASLKMDAAMDWGCGLDTKLANLYDSYVMMKRLSNVDFPGRKDK